MVNDRLREAQALSNGSPGFWLVRRQVTRRSEVGGTSTDDGTCHELLWPSQRKITIDLKQAMSKISNI